MKSEKLKMAVRDSDKVSSAVVKTLVETLCEPVAYL